MMTFCKRPVRWRGLAPSQPTEVRNGIRLFPIREGAGTVTPEAVRVLLEETD